ncbi:major facilitator superfamily domain-containing protein [Xylaria bambusicola]|uniref:major facilitator superfamily domain-containing protein n=1 Tax=Xylaria bambusicola TaxID=326684 RepID=UPI0020081F77|nr:major facilitator superfamily domain-containing protein [Xylaria bambusicola]KAI0522303.1 major facilitator superfamily domain-containing protein [Xylaria bambusicola]
MAYQHLLNGWRQVTLVAILLIGLLFSSLDASIVSTSLVTISIDLQDFLNAPWVVLAYLLAYLGLAIGFAKLSDIYGRRDTLCAAWILFAGFSIGCALAQTMPQLIICRVFQGMGGSGLYSLAQIALFEVGPAHKPSLMGAMIGLTLAISYVLGPILGGVISSTATWRWVFWINVPFGVVLVAGLYLAWPTGIGRQRRGIDAIRRIDFLGNILIIAACALLVFALQEAGAYTFAWNHPVIILALIVSVLSWLGFVAWEIHLSSRNNTRIEPILPLRLVCRVYSACVVCTFCTGFTYLAILVILPERFQIVNGDNALYSGIHLLPMLGATALGAFCAGAVSRRRNNTSWTLLAAHCLQLLGAGLMLMLRDITTEIKAQYIFQLLLGLGIGLSLGAATIMASVQSSQADLAVAQGIVAQARVFGGSIGIALCSIILNTRVAHSLSGKIDPADLEAIHHSPTIAPWLPSELRREVKMVYAEAFTDDIKLLMGIIVVGIITSCFTHQRHPPPMPGTSAAKEALGAEHSEMELDDFPHRP